MTEDIHKLAEIERNKSEENSPFTVLPLAEFRERLDTSLRNAWQRHAPDDIKPWFPISKEESENDPNRWKVRSTLDIYARFSVFDPVRFRIKHTLKPLRFVSLKSEATALMGERQQPDIGLELKLLGVLKFRLTGAGSEAQLRVRAPLAYDKAEVDVVYERRYGGGEGVRVAFRFKEAAYAKVPGLSAGIKFHNRLHPRVKTTLRIKRGLTPSLPAAPELSERQNNPGIRPNTPNNIPNVIDRISGILLGSPIPRQSYRVSSPNQHVVRNRLGREKTLFDATKDVLTNILEVKDLGLDVKCRWIDQGGSEEVNTISRSN